jgi:hypothetical protein
VLSISSKGLDTHVVSAVQSVAAVDLYREAEVVVPLRDLPV